MYTEYLEGKKDFDTLYEELTSANIFDLYAGWWAKKELKDKKPYIRNQENLIRDVVNRWQKVKKEVQDELLTEGCIAIMSEMVHLNYAGTHGYGMNIDLLERYDIDFEFTGEIDERYFTDEVLTQVWVKYFREGIKQDDFKDIVESGSSWPERKKKMIEQLNQGGYVDYGLKDPSSYDPANADVVRGEIRFSFGSLRDYINFALFSFSEFEWPSAYGKGPWSTITKNILKLWDEYPNADFKFLDHVIDLAHNTGTWVNKFKNRQSLLDALDRKFEAETPKDYVDKITDRKIKSAVQRIRV